MACIQDTGCAYTSAAACRAALVLVQASGSPAPVLFAFQAITKALDTDAQQAGSAITSSAESLQDGPGQLLEGLNRGLNQTLHEVLPGLQESFDATASEVSSQVGTLTVHCGMTRCTCMLLSQGQKSECQLKKHSPHIRLVVKQTLRSAQPLLLNPWRFCT